MKTSSNEKKWLADAPSNIALIKYMGKEDRDLNSPINASLSYTIDHLLSRVELELNKEGLDRWEPLVADGFYPVRLSDFGKKRFLDHLHFLRMQFQFEGSFVIRSSNNFPADCGIASSASSFAALTLVAVQALQELTNRSGIEIDVKRISDWSRQGSGSSCRSFYKPWCFWGKEGAKTIRLPLEKLYHQVIVITDRAKEVSSSQAHQKVNSSLLYEGRVKRAEMRLDQLIESFNQGDWRKSYEICWSEFWDMHALFETSHPHFGYISEGSMKVLRLLEQYWEKYNDGPLVTMDAGANIHLLYKEEQRNYALRVKHELSDHFRVISEV